MLKNSSVPFSPKRHNNWHQTHNNYQLSLHNRHCMCCLQAICTVTPECYISILLYNSLTNDFDTFYICYIWTSTYCMSSSFVHLLMPLPHSKMNQYLECIFLVAHQFIPYIVCIDFLSLCVLRC